MGERRGVWGSHRLETGRTARLDIGPLELRITHLPGEWRLALRRSDTFDAYRAALDVDAEDDTPEADWRETSRLFYSEPGSEFSILPRVADRNVVSLPIQAFGIPPGQRTTLFVSTPVWVELQLQEDSLPALDVPTLLLSDTWFGPSTLEGEICYSSRTHGRHQLAEVPLRPFRAVTPVTIANRSPRPMPVEKLNLPIPFLPLYQAGDDSLWTPAVTMTREEDAETMTVKLGEGAPAEAVQPQRISDPRRHAETRTLIRAFSAIFS